MRVIAKKRKNDRLSAVASKQNCFRPTERFFGGWFGRRESSGVVIFLGKGMLAEPTSLSQVPISEALLFPLKKGGGV